MARAPMMVDFETFVEGLVTLIVAMPPEVARGVGAAVTRAVGTIEEAQKPAPKRKARCRRKGGK